MGRNRWEGRSNINVTWKLRSLFLKKHCFCYARSVFAVDLILKCSYLRLKQSHICHCMQMWFGISNNGKIFKLVLNSCKRLRTKSMNFLLLQKCLFLQSCSLRMLLPGSGGRQCGQPHVCSCGLGGKEAVLDGPGAGAHPGGHPRRLPAHRSPLLRPRPTTWHHRWPSLTVSGSFVGVEFHFMHNTITQTIGQLLSY